MASGTSFGLAVACALLLGFSSVVQWTKQKPSTPDLPCRAEDAHTSLSADAGVMTMAEASRPPPPVPPDLDTVSHLFFTFGNAAYFPMVSSQASKGYSFVVDLH